MFDMASLKNIREQSPIVHNITNYVTVNDCANILLAIGASPIMADDINEVEEITSMCKSLVINIGTLKEQTINSMIAAGLRANVLSHPVILDPVGVGASTFRTDTVRRLMSEVKFAVIRGNISEIKTIYSQSGQVRGVDANCSEYITDDNLDEIIEMAMTLSKRIGAVVVITGSIDVIANENKAFLIYNGHPMLRRITGSGCMLSSVIGACCAVNQSNVLEAVAAGVTAFGICGELAYTKVTQNNEGTASFKIHLIDYMSKMDCKLLEAKAKVKVRDRDNI